MCNLKVWKRDDYAWDPYNMEADMIKPDTRAAVPRVGPHVSTRSSKRVQREPAPGPPSRGKGPLKCQVDSCQTALEGAKEYHVRYRIVSYPASFSHSVAARDIVAMDACTHQLFH